MYEELKSEVKECEGYVNKIYKCSEGFDTIFYGHKVLPEDNYEHGVEYPKELGEEVFEKDFQRTVDAAERLIGDRPINHMWKALDSEDYVEASVQMLDSLWAKQTPARAGKLAGKMRSAKL